MFLTQCDECGRLATLAPFHPLLLRPGWIQTVEDGEDRHYCDTRCQADARLRRQIRAERARHAMTSHMSERFTPESWTFVRTQHPSAQDSDCGFCRSDNGDD